MKETGVNMSVSKILKVSSFGKDVCITVRVCACVTSLVT